MINILSILIEANPLVPMVIMGVASAIGSIVQGLLNNKATEDTNKANVDLTKEMWRMTNEYNTPQNQVTRLTAAGINPYIGASNVSSTGSQLTAPVIQPKKYDYIGDLGQIPLQTANQYYQNTLVQQQQAALKQEMDFKAIKQPLEIAAMTNDNESKELANKQAKRALEFYDDTYSARVTQEKQKVELNEIENMARQRESDNLEWINKNLQFEYYKLNPLKQQAMEADINSTLTQTSINLAQLANQTRLTNAQIDNLTASAANQMAQAAQTNFNVRFSNENKRLLQRKLKAEVDELIKNNRLKDQQFNWNPYLYGTDIVTKGLNSVGNLNPYKFSK